MVTMFNSIYFNYFTYLFVMVIFCFDINRFSCVGGAAEIVQLWKRRVNRVEWFMTSMERAAPKITIRKVFHWTHWFYTLDYIYFDFPILPSNDHLEKKSRDSSEITSQRNWSTLTEWPNGFDLRKVDIGFGKRKVEFYPGALEKNQEDPITISLNQSKEELWIDYFN